jgi:uncharacterized protein YcaQ
MLKTYDLMERHFGWERPPKPASETEVADYLLEWALRAQGLVSLDSICHLDAPRKAAIRRLIEARVRRQELAAVALDGAGKVEHWVTPEALDPGSDGTEGLVHILSPFDPLIIQRKPWPFQARQNSKAAPGQEPPSLRTFGVVRPSAPRRCGDCDRR